MSVYNFRWPQFPSELGDAMMRRTDELYGVENASLDGRGTFEASVLPLRDAVLFPNMVTPLFIGHEPTLAAIEDAVRAGETMVGLAQRDANVEDPTPADMYTLGTEVAVSRTLHIPDGTASVLTQGRRRVQVLEFLEGEKGLRVLVRPIGEHVDKTNEIAALMRAVLSMFEKCVQLNRSLPEDAYVYAMNIEDPGWLADLVGSALSLALADRQKILETLDPVDRLELIHGFLRKELDVLELEDKIHSQVQTEVDRTQREAYLREQMRAIQTELGEGDLWTQEITELRERISHLSLPEEVEMRALKEVQRLGQMPPMSPEVGIIRTYLDWVMELPWSIVTTDNLDVKNAGRILEERHYALREAKERILEYIAVRSLAPPSQRQPILCFVGPPGTGKTSLGQSIADALGRKFVRISLGGIRDEAEIRGHRRTYIGALPGRILQAMRRAATANPLFMLDEIDKLGLDYRGDPASALLEVLDPEQNHAFSDHYLELPFDLSRVLFITTANTLTSIPAALLDRLEVLEFPGYIEEEKLVIARRFLIPRQLEQNGLPATGLRIPESTILAMIREYTWEAGVRNLEREIGKACRKVARRIAEKRIVPKRITVKALPRLLGPPEITPREAETEDQIGTSMSLAWTENGGETMPVEVLLVDGKGTLQITGQVGEVMQESAQAALSYIKSRSKDLGVRPEVFEKSDIHIHVPEGAIPKDGPSAGITMATALASALTGRPVRRTVGMSGEITLRGRVLPIGGVREKVLAAYRMKLKTVILPAQNKKDLVDIPAKARSAMDLRLVRHMDEVLEISLMGRPPKAGQPATSAQKARARTSSSPPARRHSPGAATGIRK